MSENVRQAISKTARRGNGQVHPPYPEYPYSPPNKGLFNNQSPIIGDQLGQYSVYIPDNFGPCGPGVLILTSDGMSAEVFMESEIGTAWMEAADSFAIVIIVAEPYQAEVWNLNNNDDMRDDDAFLKALYDTLRKRYGSIASACTLSERALSLVGYGAGGSAAHKFGMLWPEIICGIASIDGADVPEQIVQYYGDKTAYPFCQMESLDAYGQIALNNKHIPIPAWMIGETAGVNRMKDYWVDAAGAKKAEANEYASEVYQKDAVRIWLTKTKEISPQTLCGEFLLQVQRFASDPGGRLAWKIDCTNDGKTGYFFNEAEIGGYLRRWLTFIPSTYDSKKQYPLVLGFPGATSSSEAFAGDSRWTDVAEAQGLLVVFPMGYVYKLPGGLPIPAFATYGLLDTDELTDVDFEIPDDVAFVKDVIARTKDEYSVDSSRIYASGHSNGGSMVWRLGIDAPECFTAIAPVGSLTGAYIKDAVLLENPLPVHYFVGQYDLLDADRIAAGNSNDKTLKYWGERNGFDTSVMTWQEDETGRYFTRTWTNGKDNNPLYRLTTVADGTHSYVPHECDILWQEFFGRITMDEDGKRYFDGEEIIRG